MSLVFEAVWAVILVGTSRAVAGGLLAVPVGPLMSLAAGGAGVAAGAAGQPLLDAKARGAVSAAVFALTSFLVMLVAVAVLGCCATRCWTCPAATTRSTPAPWTGHWPSCSPAAWAPASKPAPRCSATCSP